MNDKEKMLIKQESKSIFRKAFDFIKKLFTSKQKANNSNSNNHHVKNNSFTDEFEKNKRLLDLQKSFENGTIKEKDLSEDERNYLVKLYKKQIEDLQKDVDFERRLLQAYKEQIVRAQTRLKSKN